MKLICIAILLLTGYLPVFSQKHSVDFTVLVSHYSDIRGQNSDATNNILAFNSFGSLDYRLSYNYLMKKNKLFVIELEASRRTLPVSSLNSHNMINESLGIGLIGAGKRFTVEGLRIHIVSGLSIFHSSIFLNNTENAIKSRFLTNGISFGGDLSYMLDRKGKHANGGVFKNFYLKTGFRGGIEILNISLSNAGLTKPLNGSSSIIFGIGYSF